MFSPSVKKEEAQKYGFKAHKIKMRVFASFISLHFAPAIKEDILPQASRKLKQIVLPLRQ